MLDKISARVTFRSRTQYTQTRTEAIKTADALLITAGAGMGVDSGLPDFRGTQEFWRAYPVIARLSLSFAEMADSAWFSENPHHAWAFYGHRLNLYRATQPHVGWHAPWNNEKRKAASASVAFPCGTLGNIDIRCGASKKMMGAIEISIQTCSTLIGRLLRMNRWITSGCKNVRRLEMPDIFAIGKKALAESGRENSWKILTNHENLNCRMVI